MDGHPGRTPRRLVLHKTTAFTESELQGVRDATQAIKEVECLEVGAGGAWRGVWMVDAPGKEPPIQAHGYPVPRGTMVMTTGTSCLLWVAGNAPAATSGRDFFQGGKSIPKPIVLRRHMGRGLFDLLALEAMALAKMDWNNDALYDPVPVTIMYSQRLSRIISGSSGLSVGELRPIRAFDTSCPPRRSVDSSQAPTARRRGQLCTARWCSPALRHPLSWRHLSAVFPRQLDASAAAAARQKRSSLRQVASSEFCCASVMRGHISGPPSRPMICPKAALTSCRASSSSS